MTTQPDSFMDNSYLLEEFTNPVHNRNSAISKNQDAYANANRNSVLSTKNRASITSRLQLQNQQSAGNDDVVSRASHNSHQMREVESTLNGFALPYAARQAISGSIKRSMREDARSSLQGRSQIGGLPKYRDVL